MGNFKSFLLGMGVAFGFYYISRKGKDGTSILEDLLDNPDGFMQKAKDYAMEAVVRTLEKKLK